MDITVSKAELNSALQIVQSAVAKKTTMPILVNLLLSADKNMLKISASDLEMSVQASVKAQVHSSGGITVNARIFIDIIKELSDEDVKIAVTEGERVEIVTKASKFRVIGLSADEYPTLPAIGIKVNGKAQRAMLSEMIGKTLYAVSQDETRFNLNGVCFEIIEGSGPKIVRGKDKKAEGDAGRLLRLVATDGHRLALVTRPAGGISFDGRIIVPRKGLAEVKHALDMETSEEVGMAVEQGFFLLETNTFKLALRLIDGEYPDYSQVIPHDEGVKAIVKGTDLVSALRRVVLIATDKDKCARMTFSKDSLRIASSSPELGDANEQLGIEYAGELCTIGFNAQYLSDVATSFGNEANIVIDLHGELGPGKFSPQNDESIMAIVMPMRL